MGGSDETTASCSGTVVLFPTRAARTARCKHCSMSATENAANVREKALGIATTNQIVTVAINICRNTQKKQKKLLFNETICTDDTYI